MGLRRAALALVAGVVTYGVIGLSTGDVHNNIVNTLPAKGSSAIVEWLKSSIERERDTGWGPSATVFRPSGIRIDMSAFQKGERKIWERVATRLETEITRESTSSSFDKDISDVRLRLMLGDHWSPFFFIDSKLSTDSSLGVSVDKLVNYQKRLVDKEAKYFPRIDNMATLVSDITNVIGDSQGHMREVAGRAGLFVGADTRRTTYETLGSMCAACGALKAIEKDFSQVIEYQSIAQSFPHAVQRTCDTINEYPMVLINLGGHVAQVDADVSAATNQLEALQRALAAESHQAHPSPR